MITLKEFATKVSIMRKAQNVYFKTNQFTSLNKSRKLEREIDELIKIVLPQVDATQLELTNPDINENKN